MFAFYAEHGVFELPCAELSLYDTEGQNGHLPDVLLSPITSMLYGDITNLKELFFCRIAFLPCLILQQIFDRFYIKTKVSSFIYLSLL